MTGDPLSEEIRQFIAKHIDTVAQLEALLFLHSRAGQAWDVAAIAKRLYANEHELAQGLANLERDGYLVRAETGYRFQCSAERQANVDKLADTYARQLIPVTNLVHSKPRNLKAFSDAFKFRRDR